MDIGWTLGRATVFLLVFGGGGVAFQGWEKRETRRTPPFFQRVPHLNPVPFPRVITDEGPI